MIKWIGCCLIAIVFCSYLCEAGYCAEPTQEQLDFFENKIRPILIERCSSCHSTKAKKTRGNLSLDSRESALRGGDLGSAIVPGKPTESRLIKAVRYQELEMPPSGKLPDSEIAMLTKWIESGAAWPKTSEATKANQLDKPTDSKSHWAWQPLKNPIPPDVKDKKWILNPIDQFILAGLEKNKIQPVPAADRRTLIRRVHLDLIGLPPKPEDVEAFVTDRTPDAYEKLIDKLLASRHYGERWGRYWLDLARYSDGLGGFLDAAPLPDAWRYRDWVVQAFNDDLPYDTFIRLQIAGDLTGKPNAAIATGFLAIGPTYTDDGGDPDSIAKTRAETLDDRVDTVTRALLGLTVSCARCHDHKFDPIPQTDYYALAGVFNNTWIVHGSLATSEQQKQIDEHAKAVKEIQSRLNALPKEKSNTQFDKASLEKQLERLKAETLAQPPRYHGVTDTGSSHMAVAIRGDLRKPGPIVPRRFLSILSGTSRSEWTSGSGRMQLADAIASANNPLTSRVIVNRIWQHHFGQPLVRTPSNFGVLGEKATHPALLDWLSQKLIHSGWSMKTLHRTIMLSNTYRMSSQFNEQNFQLDGDNRLVWRMNPRRLDVESWRDNIISVTGELDTKMGGPPVPDILGSQRRTIYAAISRNGDRLPSDTFLRLFDFPSARATVSERPVSSVPQQYLFLLNSSYMSERAKRLVKRLSDEAPDDSKRIQRGYQLLFSRSPTDREQQLGITFLGTASVENQKRWEQYAQVLLSSHEFMQFR